MGSEENPSDEKGNEILRQMREDAGSKKHLDQRKLRARKAMKAAIENRNKEAYLTALVELGIDLQSEVGKSFLRDFEQLPGDRYRR